MRRLSVLFLTAASLFALTACSDFLDVNEDPNNASPEDVAAEPGLTFLTATTVTASVRNIETLEQNQFPQLFASAGAAAVFNNPELYTISPFTTGNSWNQLFGDTAQNTQEIITNVRGAPPDRFSFNNGNVVAQAEIVQNFAYFNLTQMFGPIPFSEANQFDEFSNPAPDPQETVLRGIVDSLDSAIQQIDTSEPGITERDVFYSGNMAQWIKFANTLKFRALLLLDSGGNDVTSEINTLLDQELIRSNADNALFPYSSNSGNENQFFQLSQDFSDDFNGDGVIDNIWEVCNSELVSRMKSLTSQTDPRLTTYCDPPFFSPPGTGIVGGGPGDFSSAFGVASPVSQNIHRPGFPERWATAAEVLLKEAEWYLRQGDVPQAQQKLEDGIRASMDFFDEKPGAIDDSEKEAYINSLPDLASLSESEALEFIQIQQWIDLFERNPANWTNWRRTKAPELSAPPNATLSTIIRRYQYPPDAISNNTNISQQQEDTPMWFEGGSN